MYAAVLVIHVIVCLILIGVVLLQQGKGADMGAVFGGSSSTVFGSSGAGNFLTRLTTGCAAVFMLTSLTLTYVGAARLGTTVMDGALPEPPPLEAPAPGGGAAAPAPQAAPQAEAPGQPAAPAAAPAEPQAAAPEAAAPAAPAEAPKANP